MAYATNTFTGDGSTTDFAIDFPYIDQAHVSVEVDGVDTAFTWLNDSTVTVSPAPADLTTVRVYRDSSRGDPLVDYTNGQMVTAADLDLAYQHTLYVAQEAFDASEAVENTQQLQDWADAASAAAAAAAISAASASASASSAVTAANDAAADAIAAAASAAAALASEIAAAGYASSALLIANDLSDLNDAPTARSNLGLGTMAVEAAADYLTTAAGAATYLPITTAQSDYVRKATQATISVSHILEQAGGAGALGSYRNLDVRNANGNTDGKRWAWVTHKNGTDDELHLALYSDADAYTQSILTYVRTGSVRKYIRFPGRSIYGGVTDDTSTDVQCATALATTSITAPLFDATAGNVVANKYYNAGAENLGNKTGAITIDLGAISDYSYCALTGNVTVTFTAPGAPCTKRIRVLQDATPRTWGFTTTVGFDKDLTAAQKTIGTTASKYNLLVISYDGTHYVCNWIREYA